MSASQRHEGTQFQQAVDSFEELVPITEELLNASELEPHIEAYEHLAHEIRRLEPFVNKCRQRVNELNPDKQTYGPAMKAKVQVFLDRFDQLYTAFQDEIQPTFEHQAQLRQAALEKVQQDVREKAQAAGKKAVLRGRLETQQEEAQRQKDLAAQRERESQQKAAEAQALQSILEAKEQARYRREAILKAAETSTQQLNEVGNHNLALQDWKNVFVVLNRNPGTLYLRVIRILNNTFYEDIARIPGSTELLMSSGFRLKEAKDVYSMIQRAKAAYKDEHGVDKVDDQSLTYDAEELYWVLEEPDPLEAFEAWTEWMKQLTWVKDLLVSMITGLRKNSSITPHQWLRDVLLDKEEIKWAIVVLPNLSKS